MNIKRLYILNNNTALHSWILTLNDTVLNTSSNLERYIGDDVILKDDKYIFIKTDDKPLQLNYKIVGIL